MIRSTEVVRSNLSYVFNFLEKLHLSTHPDYQWFDQLMDHGQFESESWQRVYQYLLRYQSGFSYFVTVHPSLVEGTPEECIKTLLR